MRRRSRPVRSRVTRCTPGGCARRWRSGDTRIRHVLRGFSPSGIRPTFFTSRCTMCPGCFAVIVLTSRFVSPLGSMNRRRFRPSCARCRVTVRRLTATPSPCSSKAMRDADHLCSRRSSSIRATVSPVVAPGCRAGVDERSSRPSSPNWWYRFTHFDAVAREMPISAATCAMGRVRQRSINRWRPSGVSGAFLWLRLRGLSPIDELGLELMLSARMC